MFVDDALNQDTNATRSAPVNAVGVGSIARRVCTMRRSRAPYRSAGADRTPATAEAEAEAEAMLK
jgi:hypothetical protein